MSLARALCLALAVVNLSFAKNNAPTACQYDTGAATALLPWKQPHTVAVHQMPDSIRKSAPGIRDSAGREAIAAIAIGYPGDPAPCLSFEGS